MLDKPLPKVKHPYDVTHFVDQLDLGPVYVKWLDLNLFNNDRQHYQRYRIESKVKLKMEKIHEQIHQRYALIAERLDGSHWVLDCQHEIEAAMRSGYMVFHAVVFQSSGWEQEKTIFDKLQELQRLAGKKD